MKYYIKMILSIMIIFMLSACVYENNSEQKNGKSSLKLGIFINNNNKIENIFEKYDYFKIWIVEENSKVIKSYLYTTKDENDNTFLGEENYLKYNFYDKNSDVTVVNKVFDKLDKNYSKEFIIENISINSEYLIVGIPNAEYNEILDYQFIKLNNGITKPEEETDIYGDIYYKENIVWNTALKDGEITNFGKIILKESDIGEVVVRTLPQIAGDAEATEIKICGPFNNWEINNNNYILEKNSIGVYEINLKNIGPYNFEYKFICNDKLTSDCLADNIDYYSSKRKINFTNKSFYYPIISIVNYKREKGVFGVNTNNLAMKEDKYDENWENKGVIEIAVGTSHYLEDKLNLTTLIDKRNIPEDTAIYKGAEKEIWLAENPNIKDVTITYEGIFNKDGELIAESSNNFNGKVINSEKINKVIVKKRNLTPFSTSGTYIIEQVNYVIDNLDFPDEAGDYLFTVRVVDKNNNYSVEQVVLNLY